MLHLPPYHRQGEALRLGVSLRAACELFAAAAEGTPEARAARLVDVFHHAPGLVLWSWRWMEVVAPPCAGTPALASLGTWLATEGLPLLAQDAWGLVSPAGQAALPADFCTLAPGASAVSDSEYVVAVLRQADNWEAAARAAGHAVEPLVAPAYLLSRLLKLQSLEAQFHHALETEKLEALAEFAAGAGHEINNPLAVISGRAQLFLRGETDPERRRELAILHQQALRVHEMIADLMLFARPPQPRPAICDAAAIADQVIRELAERAATRDIRLSHRATQRPLEIEADREQLLVALRSACDNALAAVAEGGSIEIETRPWLPARDAAGTSRNGQGGHTPAPGAEWVVTDDGPGIPAEVRRHLFDPYYSGRSAGRGLGVGLAKCWRILSNHGGEVSVAEAPARGAQLYLRVPARPARPL